MTEEFFGKPFKFALLGFVVLFGLSTLGYFANLSLPILIILGIVTGVVTYKKAEYGLALAFIELLSNAHGYILFAAVGGFRLSARMTIFIAVFVGWGLSLLTKRVTLKLQNQQLLPFIPLTIAVLVGGVVGVLHRPLTEVFQDGNAYMYFLYLVPILSVSWDSLKQRALLQILAASTVFTTMISLYILYAFTHLSEGYLRVMYVFLRDIRFAEMTNMGMGMYRIFEQTQLFAIVFGFIILERVFRSQKKKDLYLSIALLSCVFVAILVGMSRSFLFGFIAALLILTAWFFIGLKPAVKNWFVGIGSIFISILIAIIVIYGAVIFPFPHTRAAGEYLTGVFGERASGTDVAVSSRWNLLYPMLDLIKANPVLGNGFGQTVTFITDDPRIRAIHPDGSYTTTAMEWGWLELWLKMGILAPFGFLTVFISIIFASTKLFKTEKAWIGVWVLEFLTFLYFTHFFSPYLNHPIGISLIVIAVIFIPSSLPLFVFMLSHNKQKMPHVELATPFVTSKSK